MCLFLDIIRMLSTKNAPRRPKQEKGYRGVHELCWVYNFKGEKHAEISYTSDTVDEQTVLNGIQDTVDYINERYDCSDFRAMWLLKLVFDGGEELFKKSPSNEIHNRIKSCLTGFKYWISDNGHDSICYYSENHQSTFATLEYLTGQLYEKELFCDGKTGREHKERAKHRLKLWFKQRFAFGFSEFGSHNYLPINICSLSLFLRYGDDAEIKTDIKKTFDILFYDFALQLFEGTFIGAQSRAYPRNNINCAYSEPNADQIIDYVWKRGKFDYKNQIGEQVFFFTTMQIDGEKRGIPYYEVPPQIIDIGNHRGELEIKTSSGQNFDEMRLHNLIGKDLNAEMFQLGMGALTNPEVIENTMSIIKRHNLWRNDFVSSFKYLNIWFLKAFHLLPKLSKRYNFFTNGMALERVNVYTYKNDSAKLSTLCNYKPGSSGAQQTTMALTLTGGVTVYTHHPLREDKLIGAPSYWAGYGVAPHAVQHKNIALLIHNIPKSITLAPSKMLQYTHTFFPQELFDEVLIDGNYAFGRKDNALFALIGKSNFEFRPYDERIKDLSQGKLKTEMNYDLLQHGSKQFTIYETSEIKTEGSFKRFVQRIKSNEYNFENMTLKYNSSNKQYKLVYCGGFEISGQKINLEFKRYESLFGTTERTQKEIKIKDYTISLEDHDKIY